MGLEIDLPRLGVGSRRCAGNEKRTEAMSATPMNLAEHCHDVSIKPLHEGKVAGAYLRSIDRKVLSFEESSGAFSGASEAVADDMATPMPRDRERRDSTTDEGEQ